MKKKKRFAFPFLVVLFTGFSALAQQKTVTIATVNNPAMIDLKKLSPKFEAENPDIKLNWVVVEENYFAPTCDDRHFDRKRSVRFGLYRFV